jgi:predicted glycosyltransferase
MIDIVHPADVLFFKRPIEMLMACCDAVEIASRRKDVACDLLDKFSMAHRAISSADLGIIGLATELIERDWALLAAWR